ncbi:aquaporin Z [Leucobacter massiliensis]|uniref:Aquaporin Z n=1 Tax=Leucobacter massiliensis TaxID=1686285 RepID=A0A2S9QSV0_9MICO|nr:aquaporin Z [Leucobacter massiliensis]PRI12676.1 aquaporin Z [Leucobacter massiliensis]
MTASGPQPATKPAAPSDPATSSRLIAEVIGTFLLVFGGVGTAVFAAGFPGEPGSPVNVGFLGVALAFGLTVVVGAYAFGPVSGGHFNPAVSLGLAAAGRFAWRDVPGYIIAQIVGGALASTLIFAVANGQPGGYEGTLGANGYDEASPGGYSLLSVGLTEVVLTAIFLLVIIGATSKRAAAGFAPLAIGLTLTLIHLISIPISNTSVNPARSIASAIYGGGEALAQLWAFILFPVVGGLLAGWLFKPLFDRAR